MPNRNRPGHPARRPPTKSLKEKRAKREARHVEHNDTVEKAFAHRR